MKIQSVSIRGFRGYADRVTFDMEDLLVLVGKNDAGKSTILEALEIFFNENKGLVKLDKEDINKANLDAGDDTVEISVEFADVPEQIVIDTTNATSLAGEYLLTEEGTLFLTKRFPKAGPAKVFLKACHPTAAPCKDLLLKKNPALKKVLDDHGIPCADRTRNSVIRQTIWSAQTDLELDTVEIEVAKIDPDSRSIWNALKSHMPLYSLFQADRKNSDGDSEVQDPMRLAVKEILSDPEIRATLSGIADTVKSRLDDVAQQTLDKLSDLSPGLAASLNPVLPDHEALKWGDVFKNVSISGDEDIPVNKRGSGVKRLILISFFRAEAERRRQEEDLPSVIYAIEEPETSQHPDHQRTLIRTLKSLSTEANTQILLTTHSPEIVKELEFGDLRLVSGDQAAQIDKVNENELPYPSLNEVNFAAFGEASAEYHNELYGYIEFIDKLDEYFEGKPTVNYTRMHQNGALANQEVCMTVYIRHQIHHPENTHNDRYTAEQLVQSIVDMRSFLHGHAIL